MKTVTPGFEGAHTDTYKQAAAKPPSSGALTARAVMFVVFIVATVIGVALLLA
jgi:hypothetical protein